MRLIKVGLALLIAGLFIFGFTFVRLSSGSALEPQTKVPGTIRAEIAEAGRYYLWDHHWTVFEGERFKYPADCPADAQVVVTDASGAVLEFSKDTSQAWSIGNNAKTSVGFVDIPHATELKIDVEGVGPDRIFSVSNSTMQQELWRRLGGFGLGTILGIVGLGIAFVGLLTRRRQPTTNVDT